VEIGILREKLLLIEMHAYIITALVNLSETRVFVRIA
jgi:hypothetical protein